MTSSGGSWPGRGAADRRGPPERPAALDEIFLIRGKTRAAPVRFGGRRPPAKSPPPGGSWGHDSRESSRGRALEPLPCPRYRRRGTGGALPPRPPGGPAIRPPGPGAVNGRPGRQTPQEPPGRDGGAGRWIRRPGRPAAQHGARRRPGPPAPETPTARPSPGRAVGDCAGGNRTSYLQVMSLASYRCSTAQVHSSRRGRGRLPQHQAGLTRAASWRNRPGRPPGRSDVRGGSPMALRYAGGGHYGFRFAPA